MQHRSLTLALLLLAALAAPTGATRPWFHTAHAGKPYVNPDLSPDRVVGKVVEAAWDGQLVLWQGRIRGFERRGREASFQLDVGRNLVPVRYRAGAINLEIDRTGYRVAVKGHLEIKGHRLTGIDGKSLILLAPPLDKDYRAFVGANAQKEGLESFIAWWISFHLPHYTPQLRDSIASAIVRNAGENKLDPLLLASLIQIESAFRVDIVSSSGAIGLGQLMPFTARNYGVDPWNPRDNVKASARMISGLIRAWQFGAPKDPRALALAGYNAGPNLVRSCYGIPAIPQTTNYVYFIGYVHRDMTATAVRLGLVAAEKAR